MENLVFCLNSTIPIFLLIVIGYWFMKIGVFNDPFRKTANSYVFKIALPVLVFQDLSTEDFASVWDGPYVLFCFLVTVASIAIAFGVSYLFHDKSVQGEFTQCSYRSSAALLGIGFIQSIYGTSGMAPLMIIGAVPLYNVMAVILLSFLKPDREKMDSRLLKTTLLGILENPIIIGIAVGLIWSVLKIPQPTIMSKTVGFVAQTATPLGLMAMGAGFSFEKAGKTLKPALVATFLKLVVWCAIFLPLAVEVGFRNSRLIAILVMLGSPTTVSTFVMAKNMGHDGALSTSTVMLTSLLSALTLTFWLYVIKSMGFI